MRLSAFLAGLKISFPLVIGYFPVAVAFGISANSYGFEPLGSTLISVVVFAGASQFALLSLLTQDTPYVTTAFILIGLNLRHLLYSTTLSPNLRHMPLVARLAVSFGITDEVFATAFMRLKTLSKSQQWFWLAGLEIGAYSSWIAGTWVGASSGNMIIDRYSFLAPAFSFALPALFLSLLMPFFVPLTRPVKTNTTLLSIILALLIAVLGKLAGFPTMGLFAAALGAPVIALSLGER